jgi:hypothetical protein
MMFKAFGVFSVPFCLAFAPRPCNLAARYGLVHATERQSSTFNVKMYVCVCVCVCVCVLTTLNMSHKFGVAGEFCYLAKLWTNLKRDNLLQVTCIPSQVLEFLLFPSHCGFSDFVHFAFSVLSYLFLLHHSFYLLCKYTLIL